MRVTAFVGSARKGFTHQAVERFLSHLQELGEVEYEIVVLSGYRLDRCVGCKLCFGKGEEYCPLKDDRDQLIEKISRSDGVVFASPNYAFQVSAFMKTLLDRLGFMLHRPRFFGKAFTSIVVQGIYGGRSIVKYLDFVGSGLGFNPVKGCCVTVLEPMSQEDRKGMERVLAAHSRRFYARLATPVHPVPTLFKLMAFRMARTSIRLMLNDDNHDYAHFARKGWFDSDYYYPTHLSLVKRLIGKLFDALAAATTKRG